MLTASVWHLGAAGMANSRTSIAARSRGKSNVGKCDSSLVDQYGKNKTHPVLKKKEIAETATAKGVVAASKDLFSE